MGGPPMPRAARVVHGYAAATGCLTADGQFEWGQIFGKVMSTGLCAASRTAAAVKRMVIYQISELTVRRSTHTH